MVYNIIPLVLIIISLAIIIFIIVQKFPDIAAIDTKTIAAERQGEVKKKIVAERLKRGLAKKTSFVSFFIKHSFEWLRKAFNRLYRKAVELERFYQKESKKTMSKQERVEHVQELLGEARELSKKDDPEGAEQRYVEIISLDIKNIEAYKGLGGIYFEKKEYQEAKETLEYVLKLGVVDDEIHFNLGQVCRALGEDKEALEHFKEAVKLEPNNPRNLDILIEESIIIGNKSLAEKTLRQFKKANPDNQKLEEFQERIKQL